jgi:hypothetical protein
MPGSPAKTALLLLSVVAGCGPDHGADFYVHGAGVHVKTGAPFASRPDLPARMDGALGAALQYWGGSWEDLAGVQITLLDGPYVPCAGTPGAVGCYGDGVLRISTSDPGAGVFRCVEQTVLVHEVGHAVLGDPGHTDPRWMDFEAVQKALAGLRGYTAEGEADCELFLSVWRHPPDGR